MRSPHKKPCRCSEGRITWQVEASGRVISGTPPKNAVFERQLGLQFYSACLYEVHFPYSGLACLDIIVDLRVAVQAFGGYPAFEVILKGSE